MAESQTPDNFTAVRAELELKLRELTGRAEDIDQELSDTPDADWDENAIDSEQDEVLERLGKAAAEEMVEIKRALSRIDAGTYGTCSKCGVTIPAERLEGLPFATRCVKCSQASGH